MARQLQQTPGIERPAPVPTATLAGSHQAGGDGGSGNVELWNILQRGPANQQMIREDIGQHVVVTSPQVDVPRIPDSYYQDRALHGGVRSSAAPAEWVEEVFTGGHEVMLNRPPAALLDVSTQMEPAPYAVPAEWRDAPPVVSLCRRGAENVPAAPGFAGKAGIQ